MYESYWTNESKNSCSLSVHLLYDYTMAHAFEILRNRAEELNKGLMGDVIVSEIAKTPKPPYFAVIFTSERTDGDLGYAEMAEEMGRLATVQPGFLGIESARESVGITVSYWDSLEAIQNWKKNERHLIAQRLGKSEWYLRYKTRVTKVERDYGFEKD